jgi:molybdate transport system permease protein
MNHELWLIIFISLKVALCSTLLVMLSSLFLGTLLAFKKGLFCRFVELVAYLPLAMPPVAIGYALLLLLAPGTLIGRFCASLLGQDIAFTWIGAVVAAFFVSLGIGVRAIKLAVSQVDPGQLEVARLMGASFWQMWLHIIFPQILSAILSAAILVFVRSLGEFGATMILAGNTLGETRTLALGIWTSLQAPDREGEALILVFVAAVISFLALVCSEWLLSNPKLLWSPCGAKSRTNVIDRCPAD